MKEHTYTWGSDIKANTSIFIDSGLTEGAASPSGNFSGNSTTFSLLSSTLSTQYSHPQQKIQAKISCFLLFSYQRDSSINIVEFGTTTILSTPVHMSTADSFWEGGDSCSLQGLIPYVTVVPSTALFQMLLASNYNHRQY